MTPVYRIPEPNDAAHGDLGARLLTLDEECGRARGRRRALTAGVALTSAAPWLRELAPQLASSRVLDLAFGLWLALLVTALVAAFDEMLLRRDRRRLLRRMPPERGDARQSALE